MSENANKIDKLFKRYPAIASRAVKRVGHKRYSDTPFLKDQYGGPYKLFDEKRYWLEVDKLIEAIKVERDKMVRNEVARQSFIASMMPIETYLKIPNSDLAMAYELAMQAAIMLEVASRFYEESDRPDGCTGHLIGTGTKVTQAIAKYLHHECQQGIALKSDEQEAH